MRALVLILAAALSLPLGAESGQTTSKKSASSKTTSKASVKSATSSSKSKSTAKTASKSVTAPKAVASKSPAESKSSRASKSAAVKARSKSKTTQIASSKKSSKGTKKATASVQQQPTPERYTEIQQALVDRGYLGVADGTWGPTSVEALKKFQTDQNLPADGKLSALSLTALGLGPRRGAYVVAPQVIASGSAPASVY